MDMVSSKTDGIQATENLVNIEMHETEQAV